jgi:hypothetical protein
MAHIYIHHTSITIHFFFLYISYSPGQAGCPPLALSDTLVAVELISPGLAAVELIFLDWLIISLLLEG